MVIVTMETVKKKGYKAAKDTRRSDRNEAIVMNECLVNERETKQNWIKVAVASGT